MSVKTYFVHLSSIQKGGGGGGVLAHLAHKTCTRNTPALHTPGPQFFMYAKHAWPTRARNYQRGSTRQRARSTPLTGPPTRVLSQQPRDQLGLHARATTNEGQPDKGPAPPPWRVPQRGLFRNNPATRGRAYTRGGSGAACT